MSKVYLIDGGRTPITRFGGTFRDLSGTDLATAAARGVLERTGVEPAAIEHVVGGSVLQNMAESNPARIVSQRIGVPDASPAYTVHMQCASGMVAFIKAAQAIALGDAEVALALGQESMSNAPFTVAGARWGLRLQHGQFTDALKECTLAGSHGWGEPWYMIDVAEHHAEVDTVSREDMDAYAVESHHKAAAAQAAGRLAPEIVPVEVAVKGGTRMVSADEHIRPDASVESLRELSPIKPGGVITAGNASGINDGGAAALLCSADAVKRLGVEPLAEFDVSHSAMVGCDPYLMGYSAVDAVNKVLDRAQLGLGDLDLIECNEGFGVQGVACERLGKWPTERVNVDGGSIGLGHPVGMSGLRIVIHLAQALRQRNLRRGIATVPAGSGLGSAVVLHAAGA
ncbi:thiolase family protein [Nocardia australiensis]|uniref:thiolase family protein n=1 Tax=Nocardia australiensis TaxID=2887191 RepID=UPI001D14CB5C|nr:thiolase family protein [Nocardia australiensis]